MEYKFIERSEKHKGHNWFGHCVEFFISFDRDIELFEFLEESFGKRGISWRERSRTSFNFHYDRKKQIRFVHKTDALRFKLSWVEDEDPLDVLQAKMRSLYKGMKNTSFGNMRNVGKTISHPISQLQPYSSGILPNYQAKSRLIRPVHAQDMIFLDYESKINLNWYDEYIIKRECCDWYDYSSILNSEVNLEERLQQTKVEEASNASSF